MICHFKKGEKKKALTFYLMSKVWFSVYEYIKAKAKKSISYRNKLR